MKDKKARKDTVKIKKKFLSEQSAELLQAQEAAHAAAGGGEEDGGVEESMAKEETVFEDDVTVGMFGSSVSVSVSSQLDDKWFGSSSLLEEVDDDGVAVRSHRLVPLCCCCAVVFLCVLSLLVLYIFLLVLQCFDASVAASPHLCSAIMSVRGARPLVHAVPAALSWSLSNPMLCTLTHCHHQHSPHYHAGSSSPSPPSWSEPSRKPRH